MAAGDGHAIVAFKEPGSARVKGTGLRAAVTAVTVEAGVRMVERQGGEVTASLRNIGAVAAKIPPAAAPTLSRHPLVDYVEPRQRYELEAVATGRSAVAAQGGQTQPWGLSMIRAPWVWSNITTGSGQNGGVKVLVIDAPYYRGHEDLPLIPLGNCGNGGCTAGTNSHGSFVLGEITGRNNTVGIIGAAHGVENGNVYFWAGCHSFDNECVSDWIAQGIDQAVTWGVDVISMSFGSAVSDVAISNAVGRAFQADIIMIAAAGNCFDNDPVECSAPRYPAALTDVLGVSGVRDDGLFADTSPCIDLFNRTVTSRYGWWVDIAAPFWSRSAVNNGGYEDEDDNLWCGTSMATPFVTGTVALMIAKNPTIPHGDIRSILLTHAQEAGDPSWDFYYGHGIVRADSAVAAVPPLSLLQVSIAGPSEVPPGYTCRWVAQISGGAEPTSIQWSGVLSGSGLEIYGSLSTSGTLWLDVTDANGDTDGDQLFITVSEGAPICGMR